MLDSFAIGGTELNAIKVAEGLVRRSATLTVFHFQNVGPLRDRYEKLGVELIHTPLHGLFSKSAWRVTRELNRIAQRRHLELVHAHCVYSNAVACGWRLTGGRTPVLASRRWTGYSARRGLHTLNRIAQSAADAVLVNSPSLLAAVTRESPFSKPVYIPNLLPDDGFRILTPSERQAMRAQFNIPANAFVVGCVARLEPVKNHAMLLQAWVKISKEFSSAHLVIVGNGSLRSELESLAQQLNIAHAVTFTGELSASVLKQSLFDVAVLSSNDEGFPNSLLEAMAQRVPIVSTNVGGVSDLVQAGENGILVAAGDSNGLSSAIRQSFNTQDASMQRIAAAGLETARRHSEDSVMSELFKLYRSISRR